jgi:hypothetical protein
LADCHAQPYGYQFGHGNHAVYLLDALHRADPAVLSHD